MSAQASQHIDLFNTQPIQTTMLVTIIGAGIGGLSGAIDLSQRGHSVTLVEDKDGLSEFGAGLQMSSNAIRILHRWGVASAVEKVAFVPGRTLARRYNSGEVLGKVEQNPLYKDVYGFPYVDKTGIVLPLTLIQILASLSSGSAESPF